MLESRSSGTTNYLRIIQLLPIVVSSLLVTLDGQYLPWSPRYTGEQGAQKSPPLSPESYTVVGDGDGDGDGGASEPPPDPSIEGSRKRDHKRRLGIRINLREPMMRYRRSIMPQGHDQVIGGGESSTDPAAQALLQTRRKGSPGGGVRRRLRKLGKRSTV